MAKTIDWNSASSSNLISRDALFLTDLKTPSFVSLTVDFVLIPDNLYKPCSLDNPNIDYIKIKMIIIIVSSLMPGLFLSSWDIIYFFKSLTEQEDQKDQ